MLGKGSPYVSGTPGARAIPKGIFNGTQEADTTDQIRIGRCVADLSVRYIFSEYGCNDGEVSVRIRHPKPHHSSPDELDNANRRK